MSAEPMKITILENGPYIVCGEVPISVQTIQANSDGESWEWAEGSAFEIKPVAALCRCGHSKNAPYCDGTHAKVGFDGSETASHALYDDEKSVMDGPALTLEDNRPLCAVGRFCDAVRDTWDSIEATDDPDVRALVIHQVTRCPSGRLVVREKATGAAIEPSLPPSIGVVEDPTEGCSGPLWVRGGIAITGSDGTSYEARNRVTLCRCGQSKNKPFCDGTHTEVKYQDNIS